MMVYYFHYYKVCEECQHFSNIQLVLALCFIISSNYGLFIVGVKLHWSNSFSIIKGTSLNIGLYLLLHYKDRGYSFKEYDT